MAGKQAHTPGPWEIRRLDKDAEHMAAIEIRGPARMYRGIPIHDFIAKVQADWNTPEEWEANARLIAAAPDLLALAKRWAAIDAGSWAVDRHAAEKGELLAETRAIIAKAEGQP